MQKCPHCQNKIRNIAVYCDSCGKSLNNLNMKYSKDFEELILNIIELVEKNNDGYHITLKLKNLIDLFWFYLYKYSDIKKILIKEKISSSTIRCLPYDICYSLKNCKKENVFKKFIILLDEYILNVKTELINQEYELNFLTNIDKRNFSKIEDFIPLFDLKIYSYDSLYDKKSFSYNNKSYQYIKSLLVIKSSIKGKDFFYLRERTLNKIYAFYGLLTMMKNFGRITISYQSDLNEKHNLINYKLLDLTYEVSDLKQKSDDYDNLHNLRLGECLYKYSDKINKCITNENYLPILKDVKKNKDVFKKLEKYLSLYYKASVDENLDDSFIKFWTLSEKIIKDMVGKMNSDKLLKFMKKITDIRYPKYLSNRIEDLHNKRNDYIHEFKNEINQHDRNLIKLVSENLIIYMLENFNKIEKFVDYGILLEFKNQKPKFKDIKRLFNNDHQLN